MMVWSLQSFLPQCLPDAVCWTSYRSPMYYHHKMTQSSFVYAEVTESQLAHPSYRQTGGYFYSFIGPAKRRLSAGYLTTLSRPWPMQTPNPFHPSSYLIVQSLTSVRELCIYFVRGECSPLDSAAGVIHLHTARITRIAGMSCRWFKWFRNSAPYAYPS